MSSFQVLLGDFAIVGSSGAAGGNRPAMKSDAASFDVIDRRGQGNTCYLFRDPSFDAAWDFCALRLAVVAAERSH
ncbi:hypothetical protein LFL96_37010 (plasmid) [Paraburkholderia sp. D15]|uniref:hypothetical protein n=1 Tax=Paraburkholderia sp. D15 TaxID=2880218 RepID=UPI0024789685|nr:hypothetical protein [Paraburkholderia sp. D15]WGS55080.1 hypothetical protein LFL96_37010 [Paraburkholderia sp. D15]